MHSPSDSQLMHSGRDHGELLIGAHGDSHIDSHDESQREPAGEAVDATPVADSVCGLLPELGG